MDNKTIKINKYLIKEDIISCVKIINETLLVEDNGNKRLSYSLLTKEGKSTIQFEKAKAASERLNLLLSEYAKGDV